MNERLMALPRVEGMIGRAVEVVRGPSKERLLAECKKLLDQPDATTWSALPFEIVFPFRNTTTGRELNFNTTAYAVAVGFEYAPNNNREEDVCILHLAAVAGVRVRVRTVLVKHPNGNQRMLNLCFEDYEALAHAIRPRAEEIIDGLEKMQAATMAKH